MRTQYRCPVDGCEKVYAEAHQLVGHMAGTMQYDESHRWEHVPIEHYNVSAAREEVPGILDY